jgi:hypothetical protein
MTIVLIITASWLLVSLFAGSLCVAAARGDRDYGAVPARSEATAESTFAFVASVSERVHEPARTAVAHRSRQAH